MANIKNSNRNKRKYTETQKARTEQHRLTKKIQHDLRMAKFAERTANLIGKSVYFYTPDSIKKRIGIVKEVITKSDERYPKDAKRHYGNYLVIQDSTGLLYTKSRHRVKPAKEDNAF